jgi:hypothetical protein
MNVKRVLMIGVLMLGVCGFVSNVRAQASNLINFVITDSTENSLWTARGDTSSAYLPYRKMESGVRALALQGNSASLATPGLLSSAQIDTNKRVLVYVYPGQNKSMDVLQNDIAMLGDSIVSYNIMSPVTTWVPISNLKNVAALPSVGHIRLVSRPILNAGPRPISKADTIMKVDAVWKKYQNAAGMTDKSRVYVGIISDDCASGSEDQAMVTKLKSADALPASFEVSDDSYSGVRTHEGLALAELVHDVAPQAGVVFAQGRSNIADFANNIRNLANGISHNGKKHPPCQIICDDLTFREEPDFEDNSSGIETAIHQVVTENKVFYVTSAGNFARDVHSFSHLKTTSLHDTDGVHTVYLFDDSTMFYNPVYVSEGATLAITLQWDDHPYNFAANVYNLFLYDPASKKIVARTTSTTGDVMPALQTLDFTNMGKGQMYGVIVESENPRPSDTQKFVLFIHNSNRLAPPFFRNGFGSVMGHALDSEVLTCGAISAMNVDKRPGQESKSWTERSVYSSTGPVFIKDRNKPDKAFIDQVATDVPGFHIFSGTSAAAAHAAGLAAMIRSYKPTISTAEMMMDICNPTRATSAHRNNDVGYGRADADATFNAIH